MRNLKWHHIQLLFILLVLLSFLTINGSVVSASTTEYDYTGANFVVNRYVNYSDTKTHDSLQDYLWTINNNFPNNFLPDEKWRICAYNVQSKTDSSVFDNLNYSTGWNLSEDATINDGVLQFYNTEINESTDYACKNYSIPYYSPNAVSSVKMHWDSRIVSSKAWDSTTTLKEKNWTCDEASYTLGYGYSGNLTDTYSDDGQIYQSTSEEADFSAPLRENTTATMFNTYALTINTGTLNDTEAKDNVWFGGYHVSSLNNWFGTLYLYLNASQNGSINSDDIAEVIASYRVSYCSGDPRNLGGDFSIYDYNSNNWVAISEKGAHLEGTWIGDHRYVASNGELRFKITTYLVRCMEYGYTQEQCIHHAKCDWLQVNITRLSQGLNVTFPFKTQLSNSQVKKIKLYFNAWHDPIDVGKISIYDWNSASWTVLIDNFEEINGSNEINQWETTDLRYISNDGTGEIKLNYYMFKDTNEAALLYIDFQMVSIDYEEIAWNSRGSGEEVCSVESSNGDQIYASNTFHEDGDGESSVWTTCSIDLTSYKEEILGSTIAIKYYATHKGGGNNEHTPISDFRIDNIRVVINLSNACVIQGTSSIDLTDGLWHDVSGNIENLTLCGCPFTVEVQGVLKNPGTSLEHLIKGTNGSDITHYIKILCATPSGGSSYGNFKVRITGIPLSYKLVNAVSIKGGAEITPLCSIMDEGLEIPNIVFTSYEYGEYLLTLTSNNTIIQCDMKCYEKEEPQTKFQHDSKAHMIWTASYGDNYYHEGNYTYRILNQKGETVFKEMETITSPINALSTRLWSIPQSTPFGEYTCGIFWSNGLEAGIFTRKIAVTALNITDLKISCNNVTECTWFNINSSALIKARMVYAHTCEPVKNGTVLLDLDNGTILSCETNDQGYCTFNVNWNEKNGVYNLKAFGGDDYYGITEKAENITYSCTVTSLLCDELLHSSDFTNVNESATIYVHMVYAHSGSPIAGGLITTENTVEITNSSGWAKFSITKNVIGNYSLMFYAMQDSIGKITKCILNQSHEFIWTGLLVDKATLKATNPEETDVTIRVFWAHNNSVAKNAITKITGLNLSATTDEEGLARFVIRDDNQDTSGIFNIEAYNEQCIRACFETQHIRIRRLYVTTEHEGNQISALIRLKFYYDSNQSETAPNIHANIEINGYVKTYTTNKKGEIIVSNLDLAPGNSTYEIIEINDADNSWICNERHSRGVSGVITVGAVIFGINVPNNLVNPKHINGSLNIRSLCNGIKLDYLRLQIKIFDENGENVAEADLPIMDEIYPNQTIELTFEVSDGIKDLPEGKYIFKLYLCYGIPPKILTKTEAEIAIQFVYGPYSIEIMKMGELPWKIGLERHEVAIRVINENPLREESVTVAYALKDPDDVAIYNGSERLNLSSDGKYTLIINDDIDLSKAGNYTFNVLCLHRGQNVSTSIMAFNVKEEDDGIIRLLIWLIPSLIIAAVLLFSKIGRKQLHRPLN